MTLRPVSWPWRTTVVVLAVLLSSGTAFAQKRPVPAPAELPPGTQPLPAELAQALEARLREELEGRLLAGLSVGVSKGDLAWAQGFGLRDVARRRKATPRTTYRTASIAKSFTAIAVLQLVEEGKVGLDDDIRAWVPAFPAKPWPVTVRQLLGHLGGVSHYRNPARDNRVTKRMSTDEAIALFKDWPLVVEPGTEFTYTTYGYNLLGALVEKASGMPFGTYLAKRIFTPAGMKHAALDDYRTRDSHHAVGYRPVGNTIARSHRLDLSSRFGGGGARASIVDLLAFGRAVVASTLVQPETSRRMHVSMETTDGRLTDYGMGFAVYPVRGHYLVAHAGGQPETSTFLLMIPAEQLVIAVAANVEGQDDLLRDLIGSVCEFFLEGGSRRRGVHAADPVDEVVHEGLYRIFSYGRAFHTFHRSGHGPPVEPGALPGAFAQVSELLSREAISADPHAALKQVRHAHHPNSHRLFIRVGVHMAEQIASTLGPEALAAYPVEGALPFFEDYLRACEEAKCPEALRFSASLRADISRLAGPWREAHASELRQVSLRTVAELPPSLKAAERALHGAPVHPDFAAEVIERAQAPKTPPALAKRLLDWALQTHPGSLAAMLARAELALQEGDSDTAEQWYQRAFARPAGPEVLSPERLLARARRAPRVERLRIAVKLHPEALALWEALAAREKAEGNLEAAQAAQAQVQALSAPPEQRPEEPVASPQDG